MKELGSGVDFGPVYLMSTSTIGVAFCRELDAAHRKLDQNLVAMPVLGNPDMAAKRELFILLGGPAEAIERCPLSSSGSGNGAFTSARCRGSRAP